MADIQPNQTLYIYNLNNRIHIAELKKSLYNLFGTYGHILDIQAKSTEKLREQAFIAFLDVAAATTAMRSLEGFVFYDKPLKIQYAKTKSDAVAMLDGTYRLRTKKPVSSSTALGKRESDGDVDQQSKQAKTEDGSEAEDDESD